ncbi:amidohydrolase [Roseomonas sp. SSH11]|uniref:Amidohydrolase n=1 Tax=Pararoseomonas baculiformis TaxID=2820812 RepID=A0ABS4AGS1_9PROT|nr:amidohydrolase [Pararoseomonas baculiformis]MBP0446208.1 amidohydrolase [Pararoseomonas baculiformis]
MSHPPLTPEARPSGAVPELILLNGRVATMADSGDCTAFAVLDGKFIATGDDQAIRALAGPGTRVLNAEGRRVIPGIIDSHAHPDTYAVRLRGWTLLSPEQVGDRTELLAAIRARCAALPPGRWFAGHRLNERAIGGYPSLAELDEATGDRPAFILRTDAHMGLANSAAFAACGITPETPDPPFGRFDRADGRLTGLVRETAAHVFLNAIHGQDTEEDIIEGMEMVQDTCLSHGITSVSNALCPSKAIRAYQMMRRQGRFRMRMGIMASGREDGLVEALIAAGIQSGFGDATLRLIGVEWCPDCSTSGRTAAYYAPYRGRPAEGEPVPNTGMLLYDKEDLTRRATAAHRAGLQLMIEGVGDRGIDFALDVMEAALAAHPVPDHRMRVEHCCNVTPDILARLRRGGFIDSSATGFMDELGEAYVAHRGQEEMVNMWPHRSLIDAGIPAPGHSDFAVCRANPFTAIAAMVTRRSASGADLDARQAITPREALAAYTTLGAFAQREEDEKGRIAPGLLADFAILDTDILTCDPTAIAGTRVLSTHVGGIEHFRA